jgi:hypothetical protein
MKIDCSKHERELLREKKNVRRIANGNISGANHANFNLDHRIKGRGAGGGRGDL